MKGEQKISNKRMQIAQKKESLHMKLRLRGTELEPRPSWDGELHPATRTSSRAVTRHGRLPPVTDSPQEAYMARTLTDVLSIHRRRSHAPARRHCAVLLPPMSRAHSAQELQLSAHQARQRLFYSLKGGPARTPAQPRESPSTLMHLPARWAPPVAPVVAPPVLPPESASAEAELEVQQVEIPVASLQQQQQQQSPATQPARRVRPPLKRPAMLLPPSKSVPTLPGIAAARLLGVGEHGSAAGWRD